MRLTYPFHTIRQGFHTIKLKFLPNYLHFSKLIAIFADEFQVPNVLVCALMAQTVMTQVFFTNRRLRA